MQRTQAKELKNLIIFLVSLILVAALSWLILEGVTKLNKAKLIKKPAVKAKTIKNLAAEQETEVEKVPVAGENFETYQFKDPFYPLSRSDAPSENLPLETNTAGVNPSPGDTTNQTTTDQSGNNTAAGLKNNPSVIKVYNTGSGAAASLKVNGETIEATEGQDISGLKVVDINTADKTVEFLQGDQKFILTATKGN